MLSIIKYTYTMLTCKPPSKNDFLAILFGLVYTVSSAGETLAVKSLNYAPVPLELPSYTALLTNQLWIFMIPIYWSFKEKKSIYPYIGQYFGIGILTFVVSILRNISVNTLPGSVFSLLVSTSLVFNMILSGLFLKTKFNQWHICAAGCCICSASVLVAIAFLNDQGISIAGTNVSLGVPTAIGAAFFGAIMGVVQESIQPSWDNYNLRIVEITLVSGLITSVLVAIFAGVTNEVYRWPTEITAATQSSYGLILVTCVSLALPVIKLLARNSKYSTINVSSAFFFEFVQAASTLVSALGSILVFGETWTPGYALSIALMISAFGFYIMAKRVVSMPPPPTSPPPTAFERGIVNPIVVVSSWK